MDKVLSLFALAFLAFAVRADPLATAPLPEVHHSAIGYPTVQAALETLRAKPAVRIEKQQGWIIIHDTDPGTVSTVWSFAPQGHPAYPSVVKRILYEKDGALYIDMKILCQSGKGPCDALVREFQTLRDRMIEEIRSRTQQGTPADAATKVGPHSTNSESVSLKKLRSMT